MQSSTARILAAEAGAEILQSIRAPEFILPTLALPVAFYLLFGIVLSRGGPETAAFLLATNGVFAVMGPAIFGFGAGVASQRERGWLSLKRAAPAPAASFIGAKLFATLIFASLALLPIYAAAGFLGGVALPRSDWLLLLATHLLAVLPFSLIGLALGFTFGANAAIAFANLVFLGFAVLGGLWFPVMLFPEFLQTTAQALPSFHLAEISLSVVDVEREHAPLKHLVVITAMTLVFAVLAGWAYARQR